jgi:hypothetical protein
MNLSKQREQSEQREPPMTTRHEPKKVRVHQLQDHETGLTLWRCVLDCRCRVRSIGTGQDPAAAVIAATDLNDGHYSTLTDQRSKNEN